MYKMIMVPTDGSGFDREAIRVALRVAELSGVTLRLVRVHSGRASFGAGSSTDAITVSPSILQQERDRILGELYSLAAECRESSTANITVALEDGPVPAALRAYAVHNSVDLIVISSHGRGGIMRLSLGSVTDSLIRDTAIPVLVVKPHASYLNPGPEQLFRRIVVPLDGSILSEQILSQVVTLAKLDDARLTLLRVLAPKSSSKSGTSDYTPRWWEREVAAAQAYLYRTAAQLRETGCLTTTQVVVNDNIAQAIADYARNVRADLVAIATHGRGGISRAVHGSVADVVTRTGTTSMLVFRPVRAPTQQLRATISQRPDGIPVIA